MKLKERKRLLRHHIAKPIFWRQVRQRNRAEALILFPQVQSLHSIF